MLKKMKLGVISVFIAAGIGLIAGCAGTKKAVRETAEVPEKKEEITVERAPESKGELLNKAKTYLKNKDYANAAINILSAEMAPGSSELDHEITEFKNNLFEKLNARAIYERENVEIGKGLKNPLQYMVFFMEDEIIYPAFNIPVTFSVKEGEAQITEKVFTNTNGVADCEVINIETLDQNQIVVEAGVYFEINDQNFHLTKLDREFTLQHKGIKDQAITFVVFEKNLDKIVLNSVSGKLIEDFFVENGFSVFHGINENNQELFINATNGDSDSLNVYKSMLDTTLIAFTYIESTFSSEVTEGFYFARSSIVLNIIDIETNKIVFNLLVESVKGAGNTKEKAGRKAISEATIEFKQKLAVELSSII
jgi:hypothetical protein